jgi:hydrogenase expression/formation protein HypC
MIIKVQIDGYCFPKSEFGKELWRVVFGCEWEEVDASIFIIQLLTIFIIIYSLKVIESVVNLIVGVVMCLALPGKIIEIDNNDAELKFAEVDFSGVRQRVCVEYIEDVREGDYVIVHTGFAINKLDEADALETIKLFEELEEQNKGEINEIR